MFDAGRLKVLMIEDDEDDHLLTRELLEEFLGPRLELEWSRSYAEGSARILADEYDVCLLDYHLGHGTGLELLRGAMAHGCRTPVILLTGHDDRETDVAAMEAGAADYLVKREITARVLERSIRYARERYRLLEQIRDLSIKDELTGLLNRRGFVTLAEQQVRQATRSCTPLLLVFVDLDGMKQVNDRFGHLAGDLLLGDAANLLRRTFRSMDLVARLGGDEFAVLAVDAVPSVARIIAERLQAYVDTWNASAAEPRRVALSVGFAHFDPDQPCSLDDLLLEADKRMYRQKDARKARLAAGDAQATSAC